MAKKVAQGIKRRQTTKKRPVARASENFKNENYSQLFRSWISNPAVKYVAAGVAASILSRLAVSMSERYPEVSKFLRENVDSFEWRLGQYRFGLDGGKESSV